MDAYDDYVIHHPNGSWEINVPRLFTDVFQGHDSLTGAALRYSVMNMGGIVTRSLYNNCLDKAMKMHLMQKSTDSKNRVVYRLNIPQKPKADNSQLSTLNSQLELFNEKSDDAPF